MNNKFLYKELNEICNLSYNSNDDIIWDDIVYG